MIVVLAATDRLIEVYPPGGATAGQLPVPGRVWEGSTDSGIPVVAVITRIAAPADADLAQFEAELAEQRRPSPMSFDAVPHRLVL